MHRPAYSDGCDVVIVNYNAGPLLVDCVASAFAAGATRAIVVDNDSTDGSLDCLEDLADCEKLVVLRNPVNLGFATACNIGLQASNADRLLFLNPDSVLAPDALARMTAVLLGSEAVGMVGGLLCNPDGTEQIGGRRNFPTPGRAFMRAFGLSRLLRRLPALRADFSLHLQPLPAEPMLVEAISGACMLVRRAAIRDVGDWDSDYFLHCEDLDWCMRFSEKGWKVMFVPDARVTHVRGACSKSRPIFVERHKHLGMLRFYRKFYRRRYSALLWGLVVLGVLLRFMLIATHLGLRHGVQRGLRFSLARFRSA